MIDKETKETRLSVREFVFIMTALATALAAWAPKFLPTTATPEVTVIKNEIEDLRDAKDRDERKIRDLHFRIRTLEGKKGYENDDPDTWDTNQRSRHQ